MTCPKCGEIAERVTRLEESVAKLLEAHPNLEVKIQLQKTRAEIEKDNFDWNQTHEHFKTDEKPKA